MSNRVVSGIILVFLLAGMLTLTFNIQRVEASGTIYIRADGSIDPMRANIVTADNVTYTFTGNNYDEIIVERDNIVVDGAGYTVKGTTSGIGIGLEDRSNVTIKNMEIKAFYWGIYVFYSSNISIVGNNITYNRGDGIRLTHCCNNNSIYGNIIVNNHHGIWLSSYSDNNSIVGNNITANHMTGVGLKYSSNNSIAGNNITNNRSGIILDDSSCNNITANVFADDGLHVSDSYQNVVENNVVNGKPLVYLEKVSDCTVGYAGQVILVNCTNIQVENVTISNTSTGIQLWMTTNSHIAKNIIACNIIDGINLDAFSNNNTITENNLTDHDAYGVQLRSSSDNNITKNHIDSNLLGISLESSSYNVVDKNNISNNDFCGIWLTDSPNNTFSHNNFVNNPLQALTYNSSNIIWDNGFEGNYWSNYAGTDSDGDGIGDSPYLFGANNTDNYPLMNPYWNPCDINHDLTVGMKDIGVAAKAYGSQPGDSHWNPHADITGSEHLVPDGKVEMRDIVLITRDFGYSACITLQS